MQPIAGNSFQLFCNSCSKIEVYAYVYGAISQFLLEFKELPSSMNVATVPVIGDGFYFIKNDAYVQILKKGNIGYAIMVHDRLGRMDLDPVPKTFTLEGVFVGNNNFIDIGMGFYYIHPLILKPCLVEVFGRIFISFPQEQVFRPIEIGGGTSVNLSINPPSSAVTVTGGEITIGVSDDNAIALDAQQTKVIL